ncbi:MAG TPA: hypothetical protein VMV92_40565 [Streptosporangiaceae bacterium]|nr:hypothetical protein [Streptosporangiaceae bacterium]
MSTIFELRIEWLDAPGVSTSELAATWARYEIWVGNRCVTQVETADGTFRRSVFGSLYPLAEWIASNWWVLTSHIRPSAIDTRYWTWPNVRTYPWLTQHNFRGAGDGMAWPDLTLVPEGAITRIVWAPDTERPLGPISFASGGGALVRAEEAKQGLVRLVDNVLDRLAEEGLPKTRLAEEWTAVAKADHDEQEFCSMVARLGLDPYSVNDQTAADVIAIASRLPGELVEDFFDTADASALIEAAEWTRRATAIAERASSKASLSLQPLYDAVASHVEEPAVEIERPWETGYAMARRVRHELGVSNTDRFDTTPWVGVSDTSAPSNGIQGLTTVRQGRCGLVLGDLRLGRSANSFGKARALGRVLARPQQHSFVLSAARGHDERVARAFAAELLAPAEGIRQSLDVMGKHDDVALEAVARYFRVSPLLVRYQYDNQIARALS